MSMPVWSTPVKPPPSRPPLPGEGGGPRPPRQLSPPMPNGRRWAVTAAVAVSLVSVGMLSASAGRIPASTVLGLGVTLAVLLVMGLRSIHPASTAMVAHVLGLAAMTRYLGIPGGDPVWVLVWIVGLVVTMVLLTPFTWVSQPLDPDGPDEGNRRTVRAAAVLSVVVVIAVLIFGPSFASRGGSKVGTGDGRSSSGGPPLIASDGFDTTVRPELSDEVVMTVRSPAPSFWRGEVFDQWDGRRWSRSDGAIVPLVGSEVATAPDDIGARAPQTMDQTFRIVAPAASVVFAAPSPVEVLAPVTVGQRPDGTLLSDTMIAGSTYTVVSARAPVTADSLRAATGETPAAVRDRYAAPPVASARTVAAARRVTAAATTTFDRVQALEEWMGQQTKYSITSPTAPKGVDVVDDFLFVSQRGWCEQIASSLVVLLRSIGVPARLATGFVPGSSNPLTDTFTVRARDAHAWTEVWFPGVGWQSFDPTAHVPFAGDAENRSLFGWLRRHLLVMAVGAAVVAAVVAVAWLVRRRRARRPASVAWAAVTLRRMERLGRAADRPRRPHETATAYGGALAEVLQADELADVGRLVDDDHYRAEPLAEPDRQRADAVLVAIEAR